MYNATQSARKLNLIEGIKAVTFLDSIIHDLHIHYATPRVLMWCNLLTRFICRNIFWYELNAVYPFDVRMKQFPKCLYDNQINAIFQSAFLVRKEVIFKMFRLFGIYFIGNFALILNYSHWICCRGQGRAKLDVKSKSML